MTLRRLPLCAELINKNFENYTLLDLGCRTRALEPLLHNCKEYYGTDFVRADGVYECNLEEGLPQFEDNAFDIVTALDVLEHLEHAHQAFHEALRVAKKAVFVSLPNMYYIQFRLNYLKGQLSGKYTFTEEPVKDRHRWVLSYSEALNFIEKNASGYNIHIKKITPERGRTKLIMEPLETWLAKTSPNLFAYGSFFMITKEEIHVD